MKIGDRLETGSGRRPRGAGGPSHARPGLADGAGTGAGQRHPPRRAARGPTPAAVRRHLDALAADELVTDGGCRWHARGRGRPARRYVATDRGHSLASSEYDDLATSALRYLRATAGRGSGPRLRRAAGRRAGAPAEAEGRGPAGPPREQEDRPQPHRPLRVRAGLPRLLGGLAVPRRRPHLTPDAPLIIWTNLLGKEPIAHRGAGLGYTAPARRVRLGQAHHGQERQRADCCASTRSPSSSPARPRRRSRPGMLPTVWAVVERLRR